MGIRFGCIRTIVDQRPGPNAVYFDTAPSEAHADVTDALRFGQFQGETVQWCLSIALLKIHPLVVQYRRYPTVESLVCGTWRQVAEVKSTRLRNGN